MARKAAPSFISRAGVAKLADLSVDEVRALYDAGELPPVEAWYVDVDLARPLWLIDTIEQWVRERWVEEDRREAARRATEKLADPPAAPLEAATFYISRADRS